MIITFIILIFALELNAPLVCCFKGGEYLGQLSHETYQSKRLLQLSALAKLQNFCIGESDISDDMPSALSTDTNYIMNSCNGHVELIVFCLI